MSYRHGSFVWFDNITPDVQRAKGFYGELFGYTHDTMQDGANTYFVLKAGDLAIAGLTKSPLEGAPGMWVPYVQVEDVDRIATRAPTLGGRVTQAPADIPNVGRMAVFTDLLGASFAVLHPTPR